jgi:hypothetical protein
MSCTQVILLFLICSSYSWALDKLGLKCLGGLDEEESVVDYSMKTAYEGAPPSAIKLSLGHSERLSLVLNCYEPEDARVPQRSPSPSQPRPIYRVHA